MNKDDYCNNCGTTEVDKMMKCIDCGLWLGEEE
jgi:predicted ATP-dependent serine protease